MSGDPRSTLGTRAPSAEYVYSLAMRSLVDIPAARTPRRTHAWRRIVRTLTSRKAN